MKEAAFPARFTMIVTNILDAIAPPEEKPKTAAKPKTMKTAAQGSLEREARKEYVYYTRLIDADTQEVVGHLSDISTGGFKVDSQRPLPINKDFRFTMKLSRDVTDKPDMMFVARSRWCRIDPIDPYVYNIGYQLINISPTDLEIFNRMMEKFGREYNNRTLHLRRSNKW